ncbi:MAG: hypothetical protein L3J89_13105 [Gammaproteobacteria bacterium]|nr:hypothetical protein [Gammaproteobacteria bacterium]
MGQVTGANLIKPALTSRNPLYLVIDQGGHASRAFIFNQQGEALAQGATPIAAQISENANDHIEYNAVSLLKSIQKAIHQAIASSNVVLTDIVAAGIATQRSNIVCWDRITGQALSPIISWQDRRAASWIEAFKPHEEQVHQTTGLFLSPHYGVGKLQWCYENIPAISKAHHKKSLYWGPMTSFLLNQLLDESPYLVDHVNASRTLLWNIKTLDWDPALAQLFGFPNNPLPTCVPNRYSFGTLTIDGHPIPMTTVIGDQSASLFAWQQLQHDALYINIGTGGFIQRIVNDKEIVKPDLLTSLLISEKGGPRYALEGTVNGAGSALSWIEKQLTPDKLYQQLPRWLENSACPLLFLNGVSGIGSPYWQADFESRFIGMGNDQQKIVAVTESIVFLLQVNIERLQQLQPAARKILISGGLAQLDGLCQRIADLSGLVVERIPESEATASGVAWLLANTDINISDHTTSWHKQTLTPIKPGSNPSLAERYQRWSIALQKALSIP